MKKFISKFIIILTLIFGLNLNSITVHASVKYPYPGYPLKYNPTYYDYNVWLMQDQLNMIDDLYWCGVPDGYFGNQTLYAVQQYQIHNGLNPDGVCGQLTWNSIFYIYP